MRNLAQERKRVTSHSGNWRTIGCCRAEDQATNGFGAPGDDLVALWRYLKVPDDVRFLFPVAPLNLDMGFGGDARAWWMLDMERVTQARAEGQWEALSQEVPRGLERARTLVQNLLAQATETLSVPSGSLVLGGFSQGAMLATDLVLHSDISFSGLALLSGTLIAKHEWLARFPRRFKERLQFPFFRHGT